VLIIAIQLGYIQGLLEIKPQQYDNIYVYSVLKQC